jgi:hypothetical protein
MKVLTESPVRFHTGEILPPDEINRPWLYAADAVADVAQRRWAKSLLSLPYVESVSAPYTQAMSAEERTYRFTCPVACAIERAFLNGNLTTTTAPATWSITKTSGGSTPAGATTPWLSTRGAILTPAAAGSEASVSSDGIIASATDTLQAQNVDRVLLEAGAEYQVALAGTTFSLGRADVALHLAIDRWQAGGALSVPSFSPSLWTDASAPNANVQLNNQASLATQAAKFATLRGMAPLLFVRHGFTSATAANLRTFTLPRFASTRAQARIVRIYLYAHTAGATTITATLKDQAGATLATVSDVVAGTFNSADSGALSIAINGGASATTTSDYSLTFANSSATNCVKAYALVWIAWS